MLVKTLPLCTASPSRTVTSQIEIAPACAVVTTGTPTLPVLAVLFRPNGVITTP